MLLLIASLLALLVGPLAAGLVGGRRSVVAGLDGFVMVSVGGLMALHVLPAAIAVAGPWAAAAAVLGLIGPTWFERRLQMAGVGARGPRPVLVGALAGLAVHALLDGAALVGHGGDGGEAALALGVVLHRLPVGLAVWLLMRPRYGTRWSAGLLALIGAGTAVGFALGERGLQHLPLEALTVFQSLVAGSLLHVLLHHPAGAPFDPAAGSPHDHHHDHAHDHRPAPAGRDVGGTIGALAAVGLLVAMGDAAHGAHGHAAPASAGAAFAGRLLALAPYLPPALLGAAALRAWLPLRGRPAGVHGGLHHGLALAADPSEAAPAHARLAATGAPATAAITALAATPALGLDAVAVSLPLLGPGLTAIRLAAAVVLAVVAGAVAAAFARRGGAGTPAPTPVREDFGAALAASVDHLLPRLLAGVAAATLIEPLLPAGALAELPGPLVVAVVAAAGLVVRVPAVGSTPALAVLLARGLGPGAVVAALLTLPLTGTRSVAAHHGRRAAVAFALTAAGVAAAAGLLTDALAPGLGPAPAPTEPGPASLGAAALLAALAVAALIRHGPRGLIDRAVH